jgi:hypothetical protein
MYNRFVVRGSDCTPPSIVRNSNAKVSQRASRGYLKMTILGEIDKHDKL